MDLFPATVTLPDGSVVVSARVIAGPDGTTIYRWADREVETIFESPSQPVTDGPRCRDRWTVDGPAGQASVMKQSGCGCGHPLKRWRPPRPFRT